MGRIGQCARILSRETVVGASPLCGSGQRRPAGLVATPHHVQPNGPGRDHDQALDLRPGEPDRRLVVAPQELDEEALEQELEELSLVEEDEAIPSYLRDDAHELPPQSVKFVDELLRTAPESMRLVLASRWDLPLTRLVPELLGQRFERLRTAADTSSTWLDSFRRDMRSVLLAELDLRFQPVDALLAALRTS